MSGVSGSSNDPSDPNSLSSLLNHLPGMAFRCANEPGWHMQYASRGCVEVTGYSAEELTGGQLGYGDLILPDDREEVWSGIQRAVAEGQPFELVYRIQDKAGRERWVWQRGTAAYDADGRVRMLEGFISDFTTHRKQAERQRAREELFRLFAENAQDCIFRFSVLPVAKFDYVSPGLTRITGLAPQDLYEDPEIGLRLVCPEGVLTVAQLQSAQIRLDVPVVTRWTKPDGHFAWAESILRPVFDAEGRLAAIEGIARDVTARTRMETELRFLSLHDSLTGLYSRNYFEEEMRRLEAGRDYPITIIITDVDGLKIVNDSLGHQRGDEMLKTYAGVLRATFRRSDVVARVGGDEFAVILPHTDPETARRLRSRLVENINQAVRTPSGVPIGVSIGSATAADGSSSLADVLHRADRAMYRDKIRRTSVATRSIISAMLELLRAKDFAADGHISRVTALATRMGAAAGLGNGEMSSLALLAEVHDLGKVAIPDQTLFKREPLTEAEREYIEQHCEVGFRIAKASQDLAHVADLILHHHEWWNGLGYPAGLSGDSIPLSCRILAIADAYDAMTSDRPQRPAMAREQARAELRARAGEQFEPALVELFLRIEQEAAAEREVAAAGDVSPK